MRLLPPSFERDSVVLFGVILRGALSCITLGVKRAQSHVAVYWLCINVLVTSRSILPAKRECTP